MIRFAYTFLIWLLVLSGPVVPRLGAQSTAFSYQGELDGSNGLVNGNFDLAFTLYRVDTSGLAVAGPVTNRAVVVSNSLFTTAIDFGSNVFNGTNLWLEIAVATAGAGNFETLAPRQMIRPAPFSLYAVASGGSGLGASGTNGLNATIVVTNSVTGAADSLAGVTNLGTPTAAVLQFTIPQGAVGATGPQGPAGVAGVPGTNGLNATIVVTNSVTGAVGSLAGVTNLGTPTAAVLQFTIPQGAVGATGSQGPAGPLAPNLAFTVSNQIFTGSNIFVGNVSATNGGNQFAGTFFGNGNDLTNLNAGTLVGSVPSTVLTAIPGGNITGTLPLSVIPSAVVTNNQSGVAISGTFAGNGSSLTNVSLLNTDSKGAIAWVTNSPFTTNAPFLGLALGATLGSDVNKALVMGDLNGDGKNDLAFGNAATNTITVLTNNGSGTFAVAAILGLANSMSYVKTMVAADVNGDGRPDLISLNYSQTSYQFDIEIFTNNGAGSFGFASAMAPGTVEACLLVMDVNGDGKNDLVTYAYTNNSYALLSLTNAGNAAFKVAAMTTLTNYLNYGVDPSYGMAVDVNGDGKKDILLVAGDNNICPVTLDVLTNSGSGAFSLAWSRSLNGVMASQPGLWVADLNGDSSADLVTFVYINSSYGLLVETNNGQGVLVQASLYLLPVGTTPYTAAETDLNGDGKTDLVVDVYGNGNSVTGTHTLLMLTNGGFANLAQAASLGMGQNASDTLVAGDVNIDGATDLVSAGSVNGTSALQILTGQIVCNVVTNPPFTATFTGNVAGNISGNGSALTGVMQSYAAQGPALTLAAGASAYGFASLTNLTAIYLPAGKNVLITATALLGSTDYSPSAQYINFNFSPAYQFNGGAVTPTMSSPMTAWWNNYAPRRECCSVSDLFTVPASGYYTFGFAVKNFGQNRLNSNDNVKLTVLLFN